MCVLQTGFVYTCTENSFCVHLHMNIIDLRNVQGKDIMKIERLKFNFNYGHPFQTHTLTQSQVVAYQAATFAAKN